MSRPNVSKARTAAQKAAPKSNGKGKSPTAAQADAAFEKLHDLTHRRNEAIAKEVATEKADRIAKVVAKVVSGEAGLVVMHRDGTQEVVEPVGGKPIVRHPFADRSRGAPRFVDVSEHHTSVARGGDEAPEALPIAEAEEAALAPHSPDYCFFDRQPLGDLITTALGAPRDAEVYEGYYDHVDGRNLSRWALEDIADQVMGVASRIEHGESEGYTGESNFNPSVSLIRIAKRARATAAIAERLAEARTKLWAALDAEENEPSDETDTATTEEAAAAQ